MIRARLGRTEIRACDTVYDLIVVGGGVAGVCTALAAFRSGVNALLIHDRGVLGGCNSSEVRVCMGGRINLAPYENLGNVVKETRRFRDIRPFSTRRTMRTTASGLPLTMAAMTKISASTRA